MNTKLKPCPFCNNEPVFDKHEFWSLNNIKTIGYRIDCLTCGCSTAWDYRKKAKINVTKIWNRRQGKQ